MFPIGNKVTDMIGNVIVGQSGGPTAVINASLAGVFSMARKLGAPKIYGMIHGIDGFRRGEYCDLSEQIRSELDIELLKRTPSSFLGSCRCKLPDTAGGQDAVYQDIFRRLDELNIAVFLYIGGNDSMDTIMKMSAYGKRINSPICFIGVPKTIDNDLPMTDHTPGFGSAAKYLAAMTKEVIQDCLVYDTVSVTFLEIMGRNAGWLTAATALSRGDDCCGPDLIYLPEVPMDIEDMFRRIQEIQKRKKSVVVVVSEGVKTPDGTYVCKLGQSTELTDSFGHAWLTGTASYLTALTIRRLGCKVRGIEPSTLQRCSAHFVSLTDVQEAFAAGETAVQAGAAGESGKVVVLERTNDAPYRCAPGLKGVESIANLEKKIPMEWIDLEHQYVTDAFLDYARPLIQGELTPIMVDGLPRHIRLSVSDK